MSEVTPTNEQISRLLRTRTYDGFGNQLGTFMPAEDGRTRPTEEQVMGLVEDVESEVLAYLGGLPCNDPLKLRTKSLIAYGVAMLIELSYYPEQVQNKHSPYDKYHELYHSGLKELGKAVATECDGQGNETGDGDTLIPRGNFDTNAGMIGLETEL